MLNDLDQSIAAIASAAGPAPRGIVRCSGENVLNQVGRRFHSAEDISLGSLRQAQVLPGQFELGTNIGRVECEVLAFPGHRSYTRQPMLEIHTFGAPVLLELILEALAACGIRRAEPGEFTLRAFLSGRIDLAQAEGVLGVIDAESPADMQAALDQMAGGVSDPVSQIHERLMNLLADIEAGLDFVDEDIEFVSPAVLQGELVAAVEALQQILERLQRRKIGRHAIRVVLCGPTNAGKSTLFNAIVDACGGSTRAIVSEVAGTTRDSTHALLQFDNLQFELHDTAGFFPGGEDASPIDHLAAEQARSVIAGAHIVLWCRPLSDRDGNAGENARDGAGPTVSESVVALLNNTAAAQVIEVRTKRDQIAGHDDAALPTIDAQGPVVAVSGATGQGVPDLLDTVLRLATSDSAEGLPLAGGTTERCGAAMAQAIETLKTALVLQETAAGEELVAATIRQALQELGIVTGRVYTDDILDRVFSRFCIGK